MSTQCPHCGAALVKPNARFCGKCGQAIPVAVPTLAGSGAPPPTQRIGISQQQPQLLIQEPGLVARAVALTVFPVCIGSDAGPDRVQVRHPAVTRQHAELSEHGGDFWVTDLGSANGATLNGRRLPPHTPQRLIDGDILRIGDAQGNSVGIIFRCGGASPPTIST